MNTMKRLFITSLVVILIIGISGCTSTDKYTGKDSKIEGSEIIIDNSTEDINNVQVDVTSKSEYDTKNSSI